MALTKVSRGLLTTSIVDNGNATAITIDASENVGIGQAPSAFSNWKILEIKGGTAGAMLNFENSSSTRVSSLAYDDGSDSLRIQNFLANPITFETSNTERMRINSSGALILNHTGVPDGNQDAVYLDASGGDRISSRSNTNSRYHFVFKNPNGEVGRIETSGTSTGYITSSDYRLKENVVAITGATERLKQLNPSRFNFIADADTTVDGFLAHEVQDVVPEAITGTKDAVDADGNPEYQGIDQSKLVPLLVATIQELEARLTALENN